MSDFSLAWNRKHPEKCREYASRYRKKHPDRIKAYREKYVKENTVFVYSLQKKYRDELRKEVLRAYGDRCNCCRENEPKFLGLDHVNNDGAAHRRTIGSGSALNKWAKKNGFPPSLQILCHNCNLAKGFYGQCPHIKK